MTNPDVTTWTDEELCEKLAAIETGELSVCADQHWRLVQEYYDRVTPKKPTKEEVFERRYRDIQQAREAVE